MSSQSMNTAAAGIRLQQQNIDTIANNIANVGTNGYRKNRLDFSEAIYTAMIDPSLPADAQTAGLQLGHGAIAGATRTCFTPGSLGQTGRSLDLALAATGFFAVAGENGTTYYTRDGVFETSIEQGRNYLVTTGGNYVLDKDGQRISSVKPLDQIAVDSAGNIRVDGQMIATLGIWDFANPDGLLATGSKNFAATVSSGAAQAVAADIRQGFTETSNVDLAGEMTELITAQRAFSLLSRAISTADEMREIENNLRR